MTVKTTITDQALSRVPGYKQAAATLDTLTGWRANRPAEPDLPDPAAALWDAARAGRELPVDLGRMYVDREREAEGHAKVTAELNHAINSARIALEATLRDGGSHALTWLHGRLTTLATTVADTAVSLKGATTAEQAIAAGRVAAWTALTGAVAEVDEIRTAQRRVYLAHYGTGVGPWTTTYQRAMFSVGLLANSLDHDAAWHAHRFSQRNRTSDLRDLREHRAWLLSTPEPPHPSGVDRLTWWPTTDRGAYLIWAVTVPGVWVPTIDQLEAAWEAANGATVAPRDGGNIGIDDQLKAAAAARRRYYEVTATVPA
jgi:hypothetical protein